jgi:hypothetical protein
MCNDFLEQNRQVTFDWHIVQVKNWLKYDNDRNLDNVLVYASLDMRCAIERYIFEFLVLLKKGNLTQEDEIRCRSINGIFDLMRKTDQFYRKTAEFTNLIASASTIFPEIIIVDFSYLHKKWQELSEYCHKQLRPQESFVSSNRAFQKKGFEILKEVLSRFMDWKFESVCGVILPETMPDEVKFIYNKYVNNEIKQDQVKRMLTLIEPILIDRFNNSSKSM